ncbi:MAG: uncharacterized protein conserved in archaea [uncultured archaeon A07HB70]|nr:MAG: uncharacterized protein conserved in archaea [uncultured archaeon A07HB70]
MQPVVPSERQLVAAAAAVAVVAAAAVVVVPGALASPTDDGPVRPGPVQLVDVAIAENGVTGETATLTVESRLEHRGPPSPNVTVVVRAVDAGSGLLTTERTVEVGRLTGDRERAVRTNLTVPREGGYRVETTVYVDERRVDAGRRIVQGLSALTPPRAQSTVAFADRGTVPPLSVAVASTGGDRTTLAVTSSLENAGDDPVGDLSVRVVVRQAESNVVAADRTVEAGRVRPGRVGSTAAEVTVPAELNYRVDAVLLRDGVVIDTAATAVNLDPTRTVDADTTEQEVRFEASQFTQGDPGRERDRPRPEATETASGGPGFGALAPLVAALALAALALARSQRGDER